MQKQENLGTFISIFLNFLPLGYLDENKASGITYES